MGRNIIKEKPEKKYGHWIVLGFAGISLHGDAQWWCKCELCGAVHPVNGFALRNGKSTRCYDCRNKR